MGRENQPNWSNKANWVYYDKWNGVRRLGKNQLLAKDPSAAWIWLPGSISVGFQTWFWNTQLCCEKDRECNPDDALGPFDTNHSILLDRMSKLGVGGTVLQWFLSYLEAPSKRGCGGYTFVTQGFISMLFNIYMKSLGEEVSLICRWHSALSSNTGEEVDQCLYAVIDRKRANKPCLPFIDI